MCLPITLVAICTSKTPGTCVFFYMCTSVYTNNQIKEHCNGANYQMVYQSSTLIYIYNNIGMKDWVLTISCLKSGDCGAGGAVAMGVTLESSVICINRSAYEK